MPLGSLRHFGVSVPVWHPEPQCELPLLLGQLRAHFPLHMHVPFVLWDAARVPSPCPVGPRHVV